MASSIDITQPEAGNATTESVRDNFSATKSEIEALQDKAQNLDAAGNFSGGTVSGLSSNLAVVDGGTGASTATDARTNLDLYSTGEVDALTDALFEAGQTTLEITGTTTVVAETAVTASSRILLFPRDAGAASLEGVGAYVSAQSAGVSFTVTHAEYSGTRTYDYLVIG